MSKRRKPPRLTDAEIDRVFAQAAATIREVRDQADRPLSAFTRALVLR